MRESRARGKRAVSVDWIAGDPEGVVLRVKVKPRAGSNRILGLGPDGCLAIRLAAPPVDNQANQALIAFLAQTLAVPKSAVAIIAGERSRIKRVRVQRLGEPAARERLLPDPGHHP